MRMKIVKFKDGRYGVRKLTLLGYVFAVNKSGHWACRSTEFVQEFDTLEFANEVMEKMKKFDARKKDLGT